MFFGSLWYRSCSFPLKVQRWLKETVLRWHNFPYTELAQNDTFVTLSMRGITPVPYTHKANIRGGGKLFKVLYISVQKPAVRRGRARAERIEYFLSFLYFISPRKRTYSFKFTSKYIQIRDGLWHPVMLLTTDN